MEKYGRVDTLKVEYEATEYSNPLSQTLRCYYQLTAFPICCNAKSTQMILLGIMETFNQ